MARRLLVSSSKRYHNAISLAPSPPASIPHISSLQDKLEQAASFINQSKNLLILSGAGISTDSGIPDYRSPQRINTYNPIKYQQFVKSAYHRRRYWARSMLGYETQIKMAEPNTAHHIISKWKTNEPKEHKLRLITQNVDSLHLKSGFPFFDMIELHGTLREVKCLSCNAMINRLEFQEMLKTENLDFYQRNLRLHVSSQQKPDGDVQLNDEQNEYENFIIPKCKYCHSVDCMRPNIVFFGENLDKITTETSINWSKRSDCILCIGTTLQTQSSHRLLRYAREEKPSIPIIIVNIGETRGDDICDLKIEYSVSDVLEYVDMLLAHPNVG